MRLSGPSLSLITLLNGGGDGNSETVGNNFPPCGPGSSENQLAVRKRRMKQKATISLFWVKCKLIQPLWSTIRRLLKKLGIKLPHGPEILLLDIYPEKTIIQKDTCTPVFIAALFTIAKAWK